MSGKLNNQTKHQSQLCDWLGMKCDFSLLYQASRHGFNSSTFHNQCNNKGATVTLFYNTNDTIFGGYTSMNWTSNKGHTFDNKAFLFKLQYNGSIQPKKFPVEYPEYAIYNSSSYGPTFGGRDDYDIYSFSGSLSWNDNLSWNDRYVKLNGSFSLGDTYDMGGDDSSSVTNNSMEMKDIEVYAIKELARKEKSVHTNVILDRPWRADTDWTSEKAEELLTELEKYSPFKESDLQFVNILLVGQVGAGKSSFFNTVNSVVRGKITSKAASGTVETSLTTEYRRYKCKSRGGNFLRYRLCDTRGMEGTKEGIHVDDICALLDGKIPEGYSFKPSVPISAEFKAYITNPTANDKVHCVAFIIDGSTVDALPEEIVKQFKDISKYATSKGLPRVVLTTKIDKLCEHVENDVANVYSSDAVSRAVKTLAEVLGLPRNHVLPIKNYENETKPEIKIHILILQAIRQILQFADDYLENEIEQATGE